MQNPWLDLPEKAPFILPCDEENILKFNRRNSAKQERQIHLELLPEPYLGNPQANIILLNANPGFDKDDYVYHSQDDFVKANRANLYHDDQEYPFYLLNPQFKGSPGYRWWYATLERLLDQYGAKKIAKEIFVVEYIPYHSKKFEFRKNVPSQQYSFGLLDRAKQRGALILRMRAKNEWFPHMGSYHRYYCLKSWQNVVITENNCSDEGYAEICRELEKTVE